MNLRDGTRATTRLAGRLALCALLSLAGALVALTPAAGAASRVAPISERSTLELPGPGGPFPDALIGGRRMSRSSETAQRAVSFPVLGGEQVDVSSTYYSNAAMQSVVNVLGGLVHGPEMSLLSVYVATPNELTVICGQGALACYAPEISEMVISGEDGSSYGVPRNFTIAHEYGHHIANNRVNAPWTALDTGAKRWATYERVCQGTRKGQLFPGDEDSHYWDNPGEGFAETNAHLNFPAVPAAWGYSSLLRPTDGSMAMLRADITDPWTQPVTVAWNGSLWPRRRNPAQRRFSTPLDGQVEIRLNGPAGSNYDLYVLGPKLGAKGAKRNHRHLRPRRRVVERGVSGGSQEQIDTTLCGQSSIQLEVRRRSGSGPFTVTVTRP